MKFSVLRGGVASSFEVIYSMRLEEIPGFPSKWATIKLYDSLIASTIALIIPSCISVLLKSMWTRLVFFLIKVERCYKAISVSSDITSSPSSAPSSIF